MLLRFSRGTGVPAAIVRFATWSWCAHVGFKLDDGLVLDATPELGVALHEVQDDASTRYFRVTGPADRIDMIQDRAISWAKLQIGRPYDWTAIYGMAIRRDWHRDDKWFCSELVEGGFSAAGMPLVQDGHKLDRITPRDLLLSPLLRETDPLARLADNQIEAFSASPTASNLTVPWHNAIQEGVPRPTEDRR